MSVQHDGSAPSQPPHVQITQALITHVVNGAFSTGLSGANAPTNTSGSKFNCAVVSTARLLHNPHANPPGPHTTDSFLIAVVARGKAYDLSGPELDSLKSNPECEKLCHAFEEKGPVYQAFPRPYKTVTDLPKLTPALPKNQSFAISFLMNPTMAHVVVGEWTGAGSAPADFKFTDYQTDADGKDVTKTFVAKPINQIWWYTKPNAPDDEQSKWDPASGYGTILDSQSKSELARKKALEKQKQDILDRAPASQTRRP